MEPECVLLQGVLLEFDRIIGINLECIHLKTDKEIKQILSGLPGGHTPIKLTVCFPTGLHSLIIANEITNNNPVEVSYSGTVYSSNDRSCDTPVNFSKIKPQEDSYCNLINPSLIGCISNSERDFVPIRTAANSEKNANDGRCNRKSDDSGVNLTDAGESGLAKLKRGHSQVSSSGSSHGSESSHRYTEMLSRKSKGDKHGKDTFYKAKVTDQAELEPLRSKEPKSPVSISKNDVRFSSFRTEEKQSVSMPLHSDAPVSMRDIDFDEIITPPVASGELTVIDMSPNVNQFREQLVICEV